MVEIYTDASVFGETAVVTCFVITSEQFLGAITHTYDNIASSLQAELLGIRDGVKYTIDNHALDDIIVYCDSQSALELIEKRALYKSIVDEILSLCEDKNVNFFLIKGHQLGRNPNKVVDLMCNSVLRFVKKKG